MWPTDTGKANILVMPGLEVNDIVDDPDMLRLATVRSHDQYNTTIYSYSDRYRGVYNDRNEVFMNIEDRLARGLVKEARGSRETKGRTRCWRTTARGGGGKGSKRTEREGSNQGCSRNPSQSASA